MKKILPSLLALACLLSCKKTPPASQEADKSKGKDLEATASPEDEKVDIPSNIVGSYLACALKREANADTLESEYGCRLSDAQTKNKIEIKDSSLLSWTANIKDGISIVLTEASSPYHALYRIKGSSLSSIQETIRNLEIIANWTLASGSVIPVKRDKISNILRPDVELETYQVPIDRPQSITPD